MKWLNKLDPFRPGKPFLPGLIYIGKATSLPYMWCFVLTRTYQTKLERLYRDELSSLLGLYDSDGEKNVCLTFPPEFVSVMLKSCFCFCFCFCCFCFCFCFEVFFCSQISHLSILIQTGATTFRTKTLGIMTLSVIAFDMTG